MQEQWKIYTKKADFYEIGKKFGITPYTARMIRNRDVVGEEEISRYLRGTLEDLPEPSFMKGIPEACEILQRKMEEEKKIRIIGDYDADGVNSIYILYVALVRLGAKVDWVIPDRIKDGYGLNENFVYRAEEDQVDTLLTCDNGIAAFEAIGIAKEKGMTVIVTDHHDIPHEEEDPSAFRLPAADVIVNPKQPGCEYPYKGLCGAGVAFMLVLELYKKRGIPAEEAYDAFLPFAAIATVGDVMDLTGVNRILVKEGLNMLRSTGHIGLNALFFAQNIHKEKISSYHIGFVIAPALNAGGRLDTAKRAVNLLLCNNPALAERLAEELKSLNDLRKEMTVQGTEDAIAQVESTELKKDKVLVVFLPDCHESLAGIIAGKVREKFNKPAIVLTRGEHGVKGSGRSIETYSMFEKLNECREFLDRFGGHPMAAGLSLQEERIPAFRKALNDRCGLTEADLVKQVWIDMQLPFEVVTPALVRELEVLEPFGKGNPKPVFGEKDVAVVRAQVFGRNRNVLKLTFMNRKSCMMQGVIFGDPEDFFDQVKETYGEETCRDLRCGRRCEVQMTLLYYPEIDTYGGKMDLQVHPVAYRFVKS